MARGCDAPMRFDPEAAVYNVRGDTLMNKLNAYVRITCIEAARIAQDAIDGIADRRRIEAGKEADKFVAHATRPRWLRRRVEPTEARLSLENHLSEFQAHFDWESPAYRYWSAMTCLHDDELRAAKALLESSDGRGKGGYVLINPEDMARMRSMATPLNLMRTTAQDALRADLAKVP